jgi:rare lipoprotein A
MTGARRSWMVGVMVAGLTLSGCSGVRRPAPVSPPVLTSGPGPAGIVQTGIASWYGPGFHGRQTANGEVYDQHELTAAHPSLPMGARVMVTNLDTGESVKVRINDRGPFVHGRVIDLSYAAARSIGVYGPGTVPVRIEAVPAATQASVLLYAVQLGSYVDAGKAAALKARLVGRYADVYISPMAIGLLRYYQVRLGPFTQRGEAIARAQEVAQAGMSVILVEEDDRWAEP